MWMKLEKKVRNYTSTCTRQFRIIWLANKGLIYWSVWCNGESTRAKKNICLIAIRTGGAGMAKLVHFNNFFYLLECDIVESWNGTRMNQTTPERRSRKKLIGQMKFLPFFCTLHLNHSVLLLVTDIKREEKSPKKKTKQKYMKQFQIDKLLSPSTKFWFRLL